MDQKFETIVFGGGCFWCTEAVFSRLKGIKSVESGYTGGTMDNPTYEQVSTGATGHAEVIKIEYDPRQIGLEDLLAVFFATHNPSTPNQQGNDIGPQYRSAVFYTNEKQREQTENFVEQLEADKTFASPVVTEITPLKKFYPAEKYHQRYFEVNASKPYCQIVINPKLAKLRQKFSHLLKPEA